MAQEFIIKSPDIESKINQLLPSQGGFEAGVDFSASTMVIPIVDLTETAEGSSLRQDLQTSFSLGSITAFSVSNTTSTLVNTTGYFRCFGSFTMFTPASGVINNSFNLTDGTTTKKIINFVINGTSGDGQNVFTPFDFNVFLPAGVSLTATSGSTICTLEGNTRQIADINGNLTNP